MNRIGKWWWSRKLWQRFVIGSPLLVVLVFVGVIHAFVCELLNLETE